MREASKRVLGLRPFDVQLIGGMILHEGQVQRCCLLPLWCRVLLPAASLVPLSCLLLRHLCWGRGGLSRRAAWRSACTALHPAPTPPPLPPQLTGTLPGAWAANGSFTVLRTLSLGNNNFSGGLPDSWAGFPALESLSAGNAGLSGPLPLWGPGPEPLATL